MIDKGDWYCRNCGYLEGSRVTHSETCETCHIPVEWHDANTQTEIERLQSKLNDAREILARVVTSHLKDDPDADAIGVRITEFLDE